MCNYEYVGMIVRALRVHLLDQPDISELVVNQAMCAVTSPSELLSTAV